MKLEVQQVTKRYSNKTALQDFSAVFESGIYGLLGPNGAGKSTLIKIIVNLLRPTSGQVTLDGKEVSSLKAEYRKRIGYLPQSVGMYKNFSGRDMMLFFAALKGIEDRKEASKQVDRLLEMVNLTEDAGRKVGQYSGGMRQRLGIAQALLGSPDILIFDEPTAGLDPKERIRFKNIISELAIDKIILLATHIVSDVEYIANEIWLMKDGRLLRRGTAQGLIDSMAENVWKCFTDRSDVSALIKQHPVSNIRTEPHGVELRILSAEKPLPGAVMTEANLEDVFLYYFGEKAGEEHAEI